MVHVSYNGSVFCKFSLSTLLHLFRIRASSSNRRTRGIQLSLMLFRALFIMCLVNCKLLMVWRSPRPPSRCSTKIQYRRQKTKFNYRTRCSCVGWNRSHFSVISNQPINNNLQCMVVQTWLHNCRETLPVIAHFGNARIRLEIQSVKYELWKLLTNPWDWHEVHNESAPNYARFEPKIFSSRRIRTSLLNVWRRSIQTCTLGAPQIQVVQRP